MYVTQSEIRSRAMEDKRLAFLRKLLRPIDKLQGILSEQTAVLNTRPCKPQD